MEKRIGLALFFVVLATVFAFSAATAKSYKPLSTDITVDIPDDVNLPDLSGLEMFPMSQGQTPDGSTAMVIAFVDPDFQYLNGEKEIAPYMEIVKLENGEAHLVLFSFVNKEGCIEVYSDDDQVFSQPATGKLLKVSDPNVKVTGIRKVPRPKQ